MAKENTNELIEELLEQLTKDVSKLSEQFDRVAKKEPAPNYGPELTALTQQVASLQAQLPKPTTGESATTEAGQQLTKRLTHLEWLLKQRPEYKLSQYVQWGGYVFGLLVVLVAVLTWKGLEWRGERDHYEQAYSDSEWRVRYTRQANAEYYAYMEGQFSKDPAGLAKWVIEQEQADQKRELARQASEQAKALSQEANQLESKSGRKGK